MHTIAMSDPSTTIAGASSADRQANATTASDPNAQAGPSSPRLNGDVRDVPVNGTTAAAGTTANTSTVINGTEVGGEPDLSQMFASRREEEGARRDRSLAEFLAMLDGYKPLVRGVSSFLSPRQAMLTRPLGAP